jgi:hypothetical protein
MSFDHLYEITDLIALKRTAAFVGKELIQAWVINGYSIVAYTKESIEIYFDDIVISYIEIENGINKLDIRMIKKIIEDNTVFRFNKKLSGAI